MSTKKGEKNMKQSDKKRLFELLVDAVFDDIVMVFDMKRSSLDSVVDVCMNGDAIQLTIRPVVRKRKYAKKTRKNPR